MAGQSVGQVSMDLVLQSKDFKRQLTNSVNDAVKSAGNSCSSTISSVFGKLGAIAAAAFSVKALFDFGKSAIQLGSDLAEVQNVVDVAFGDMASAADEWAKGSVKNFGLSETSAKRYLGTFGAMASSFGYSNKEALEMAETLTGLTGDVASFYNLNSQEAYTKLKSVFTGETESIKELGVVMTQTALDQFALQKGFGKTTKNMTEQEKVALRLAFVTDRLSNASGDFLRTQDSWANQTRILSEQWNAFKAQLGQALIQVLTPLIKALNTILERLIQIATVLNNFTAKIFGKQDVNGTTQAAEAVGELADNTAGVGDAAEQTAKQIKRSLMGFDELNKLNDNSEAGGAGGAGSFDFSEIEAVADLNKDLDEMTNKFQPLIDRAKELFDLFKEGFGKTFDASGFKEAAEHAKGIFNTLKELAFDKDIQESANTLADKYAYNFGRVSGSVGRIAGNIADNFTAGWDIALESHKGEIKQTIIDVFDFEGRKSDLRADAVEAVGQISDVFKSEGAKEISAAIDGILIDVSTFAYRIYERLSTDIVTLLVKPLTDNADKIQEDLQAIIDAIAPYFSTMEDFTNGVLQDMINTYDEKIHPALMEIADFFSRMTAFVLDLIKPFIDKYLKQISDWFKDFTDNKLKPLWADLVDMGGEIMDLISGIFIVFEPIIKIILGLLAAVASVILDVLIPTIENAFDIITTIAGGIIKIIKGIVEFLDGVIHGDVKKIFEGLIDIVGGIMKTVAGIVDSVINSIIDAINKLFNTTISKSNLVGWVEDLVSKLIGGTSGNKKAENNVPFLSNTTGTGPSSHSSTTHLAQGGYVKANTPQLAIIGDNKHEGEIVAPESKIAEAVARGMQAALVNMNIGQTQAQAAGVGDITIPIILDGNELDRVIVTAEQRRNVRNGGRI